MTIEELKYIVENNKYSGQFFIFQYSDSKFIAHQYIERLVRDFGLELIYKDEIDSSIKTKSTLFENLNNRNLRVFDLDNFDITDSDLGKEINLIIICKKMSSFIRDCYSDQIVSIPKIEEWQIKDFVYSLGNEIVESDLDKLIELCGNDIYRLSMELDKMIIFPESIRKNIFKEFFNDGVFNDLSDSTIFDFCTSIVQKDIPKLIHVYSQLDRMDVNPLGFVSILYQNFKDIIKIQLSNKATPENTNIPKNRFFAIKYNNLNKFNQKQLISIFKLLSEIDKKLKIGQLDVDNIIDYLIVSIFSM